MSNLQLLRSCLRNRQNDLERLRDCRRELRAYKQEFNENERHCIHPDLSAKTWQGKLAKEFENIRTEGILAGYRDLENKQLNQVIERLSQEIQSLEGEIADLKEAIIYETNR